MPNTSPGTALRSHVGPGWRGAALMVGLCGLSGAASAQDPRGSAPETASSPNEVAQPGEQATDEDDRLETATPDPNPPVPRILQRSGEQRLDVVEQAGVGGPVAYGSASVLEVGGAGAFMTAPHRTLLRLSPYVGWFVFDGLRLSFTHEIYATIQGKERHIASAVLVGASLHARINERLLLALGGNVGPLYNGSAWGVLVRPQIGPDVLVGRSAIFRPALFASWANIHLVDSHGSLLPDKLSLGFDISFSAMF